MTRCASQIILNCANKSRKERGFTIVELLIVIVVIGILSTLVIVAYRGIRTMAEDASLQSETKQALSKIFAYRSLNSDTLPADLASAGFAAGPGHESYYRLTPDTKDFCLALNIIGNVQRVFSATSTDPVPKRGTCKGYILVPGNSVLGTNDFWVMKYDAKKIDGIPTSQAGGLPWVSISQTDAIAVSAVACDGCHLISEAEWMTLAANVLSVPSNWSGGSVGSGYIYSGHNDNNPANALEASSNDNDGYTGTGQMSGNQRRTLTLTNGEVIWDMAGNVWNWTQGKVEGSPQPGLSGETAFSYKQWNASALEWGSLPSSSRPSALASVPGLSAINSWSSSQGIGQLYSNRADVLARAFRRGEDWDGAAFGGILALTLMSSPTDAHSGVGFRVTR